MSETYSKAEKRALATAGRAARGLAKLLGGSARKRAMLLVEHTARLNMGAAYWLAPEELRYLQESFKTPDERILYKKLMNAEEAQRVQLLAARAALSELMEFVEGYVKYRMLKENMEAMAINLNNLLDTLPDKVKKQATSYIIKEFKGPYIKFMGGAAPREHIAVAPTGGPLDIDENMGIIKEALYRAQDKLKTVIKVNRDLMAAHKVQIKPYAGLIDQIDKYAGAIKHLRGIDIRPWEAVEINQALYNRLTQNLSTWKPVGRGR